MSNHYERVAHRGGSRLAPENTMGAFRHALTMPIDAIELDVQMSRDGQPIVFHDNTVERLTEGEGNILDLDFPSLQTLNAAAHFSAGWPQIERIPTLSEVLALARNRVRVYIEIKTSKRDGVHGRYPHIAETVVREVRAAAMLNQVLIISFDWPILKDVKDLEGLLETGAIVSRDVWNDQAEGAVERLAEQVKALGCEWINLDQKLFTPTIPQILHSRDLKLGLWTVNTLEDLQRFAAADVDSLTTDRPDLFAQTS